MRARPRARGACLRRQRALHGGAPQAPPPRASEPSSGPSWPPPPRKHWEREHVPAFLTLFLS